MPSFQCSACLDDFRSRRLIVDGDIVCPSCVTAIFELATQESEYPAHYGPHLLTVEQCASLLSPEVIERYQIAGRAFDVPPIHRVYCKKTDPPRRPDPCHTFVGCWKSSKHCVRCDKCMWYTCLRCEETFSTSNTAGGTTTIKHDCHPDREDADRNHPLAGLRRGRDYQHCPECKRTFALWDGCNHMRCICKAHFCFICGKNVVDGHGHWRSKGGCPRWNFPGDHNAIFDNADRWNDNGAWNVRQPAMLKGGRHPDDVYGPAPPRHRRDEIDEPAQTKRRQRRRPQDHMRASEIMQALREGRLFLQVEDPEVHRLIEGLTMHMDPSNLARPYFLDLNGNEVEALRGLDESRIPRLVMQPAECGHQLVLLVRRPWNMLRRMQRKGSFSRLLERLGL